MHYEVQHHTLADGWKNTWSFDEGDGVSHAETFATREEAQAALDEYLGDLQEELRAGNIEAYDPDEFRVEYVPDTTTEPTINQEGETL